jgi:hypothetical protein
MAQSRQDTYRLAPVVRQQALRRVLPAGFFAVPRVCDERVAQQKQCSRSSSSFNALIKLKRRVDYALRANPPATCGIDPFNNHSEFNPHYFPVFFGFRSDGSFRKPTS